MWPLLPSTGSMGSGVIKSQAQPSVATGLADGVTSVGGFNGYIGSPFIFGRLMALDDSLAICLERRQALVR